ncbi:D-methionine transport system substrate-binding protein [Cupriavidus metallidurans]|jgi:YaeC family lipoprotein|uniref:NLPA lipoprotein n=1 Tax=Cupriavidus metallidurans (strain ATCC 43123 / DSM 2839 / NBRC 102507 / CH34) TaxID=266264 RepID=Q1LC46_CUPMC|nr:MetQ/NlpA family ABC transporter substrate-binding protein [Cupriavidus metallidurans]ABF12280.1 NLPA lipoprotein [Cupriavidus metallidurans CH34]AVA35611.1 metal ABC transporter substrate-binding protein [Cupriavidus metallidurans]KWW35433.1 D-methionine-binding lipoprotein MetQ [Cupriavidus metallidurans]MDE4921575.1 MetQ/NlpA family ABC transporter substrate-binding protein [Cupriavidus metallidurans]QGS32472.1 metal ABC transporter substrate-binding protein [Cupriavidus metallidurans]
MAEKTYLHRRGVLTALLAMALPSPGSATAASGSVQPRYTVRIGVVAEPDSELVGAASDAALREGVRLETVRFASVAQANAAVTTGRIEANIAQDGPSLARAGSGLLPVAHTVTYPMGLYSRTLSDLRGLPPRSVVAFPAEPSAQGRALLLLQGYGLIRISSDAGLSPRTTDIVENRRGLRWRAVAEARLAAALDNAALVALPFAAASAAGLAPARDALGMEDSRVPFANVLAIRARDRDAPWLTPTVRGLHSEPVKTFILARFNDSVRRPW